VASGTVTAACRGSGVGHSTHYHWLQHDPAYAQRFKQSELEAIDVCETEARRRAIVGVDEPVFYQGRHVGAVRKYSDTLLMFNSRGQGSEHATPTGQRRGDDGDDR